MKLTSRKLRTLVAAAAVLAPSRLRRFLHVLLLGYEIDPTAVIGRSLIDVDAFRAGPGATVASLSVIRGCERVELGPDSSVGFLVWVNAVHRTSPAMRPDLVRDPALVLGRRADITMMHLIDCSDRLELQDYAVLGGALTQVLTHAFDYHESAHICAPVEIGPYTIVGTKSLLMPGAAVGARTIVAGGSVLTEGKYPELSLLAGVPAIVKKQLDPGAKVFRRSGPIY